MQKVLSSLLVLSGLFIAFSGTMAHADGGSMRDMYEKMGFSWGGGSGSGSGSHGHFGGNPGTGNQHQYDQSGDSGQGKHSCSHSGGGQQPPSFQQGSAGAIRGALDLAPPDDSSPPAPTTTPGV